MATARITNILELPDEILICVFAFLDFEDLREAVYVCSNFNRIAEPLLYDTIQVLTGGQALSFAYGLQANLNRTGWVRDLLISTRFGEDDGLSVLPPLIAEMRNLQNLRLETPDCNAKQPEDRMGWVNLQNRYERIFGMSSKLVPREFRRLPNLRSCTIHFVDSQKELYSLTHYSMLFLHAALKSLTISCASTDYPHRILEYFRSDESLLKSTGLEHLHLEECDLHSPTLALLLSFPRQLKSLKISEGIRYDHFSARSSRLHGDVSPTTFVDAIQESCLESLESLSLSLGHRRNPSQSITQFGQYLDLTAFENLKYLEFDRNTANLFRVRPCDHFTWRRLPPNLEALKVFGLPLLQRTPFRPVSTPRFPFEDCFTRTKAKHGVAKLKNLIFTYEYYRDEMTLTLPAANGPESQGINQVELAQSVLVKECVRMHPTYDKAGVQLQLDMRILPNGFIPPYLFPEKQPVTFTLWQSAVGRMPPS